MSKETKKSKTEHTLDLREKERADLLRPGKHNNDASGVYSSLDAASKKVYVPDSKESGSFHTLKDASVGANESGQKDAAKKNSGTRSK
jgi:hypothetical protein